MTGQENGAVGDRLIPEPRDPGREASDGLGRARVWMSENERFGSAPDLPDHRIERYVGQVVTIEVENLVQRPVDGRKYVEVGGPIPQSAR